MSTCASAYTHALCLLFFAQDIGWHRGFGIPPRHYGPHCHQGQSRLLGRRLRLQRCRWEPFPNADASHVPERAFRLRCLRTCLHTSKSRHHGITLYVCMVCQSWSAEKSGSFSDAASWKAKKVPKATDVVYAKSETDIKVEKE